MLLDKTPAKPFYGWARSTNVSKDKTNGTASDTSKPKPTNLPQEYQAHRFDRRTHASPEQDYQSATSIDKKLHRQIQTREQTPIHAQSPASILLFQIICYDFFVGKEAQSTNMRSAVSLNYAINMLERKNAKYVACFYTRTKRLNIPKGLRADVCWLERLTS